MNSKLSQLVIALFSTKLSLKFSSILIRIIVTVISLYKQDKKLSLIFTTLVHWVMFAMLYYFIIIIVILEVPYRQTSLSSYFSFVDLFSCLRLYYHYLNCALKFFSLLHLYNLLSNEPTHFQWPPSSCIFLPFSYLSIKWHSVLSGTIVEQGGKRSKDWSGLPNHIINYLLNLKISWTHFLIIWRELER